MGFSLSRSLHCIEWHDVVRRSINTKTPRENEKIRAVRKHCCRRLQLVSGFLWCSNAKQKANSLFMKCKQRISRNKRLKSNLFLKQIFFIFVTSRNCPNVFSLLNLSFFYNFQDIFCDFPRKRFLCDSDHV